MVRNIDLLMDPWNEGSLDWGMSVKERLEVFRVACAETVYPRETHS